MLKLKTYCLTFCLLLGAQWLSAQNNYILHTVLKGQGLYSISRMYGVTEQEIIALNPGSDEVIKAGQQLRIPVKPKSDASAVTDGKEVNVTTGEYIVHRVQPGETMYRLTVIYGVSGMDIQAANPKLTSDQLKAGEIIYIPLKKDTDASATTAEQQTDDDEEGISRRFSWKQLIRAMKGEEATEEEDGALRVGSYEVKSAYDPDKQPSKNAKKTSTNLDSSLCKEEHEVRLFETVYSLSRRYGITQEALLAANPDVAANGLKRGRVICIPYTAEELEAMYAERNNPATQGGAENNSAAEPTDIRTPWNGINVAVILPFQLDNPAVNADKSKMVEYYEGLLLAVDSLKHQGVSLNVYAYDSGTEETSISDILQKEEMGSMDIIFGPVHPKHIGEAAAFAAQHEIPLVLPFARSVPQLASNPMIYQVNVEQEDLDVEALKHFFSAFPQPNVLFFEPKDGTPDAFCGKLMAELDERAFDYVRLVADTTSNVENLLTHLDESADNILMMASSDKDNKLLSHMMPVFQLMARDSLAMHSLHLFGYPQYQLYAVSHMEQCQEVDTWFYSSFYTNNILPESVNFHRLFRRTYSRDLINRYPKYGILGFDTGWYFLRAISQHASQSSSVTLADLSRYDCPTIQTGFRFERVGEGGGWVNRKAYLIHIGRDGNVHRIDYD